MWIPTILIGVYLCHITTDKIAKSKVKPTLNKIANALGVGVANIYGTSSDTGFGRVELLNKLEQFLVTTTEEAEQE